VNEYPGPPIPSSPDGARQPEPVEQPDPPRALPEQDHAAMDAAERSARRFTLLIAAAAGVILAVLVLFLIAS
jgi:hypothetical protein